jgi:hypothetical protein
MCFKQKYPRRSFLIQIMIKTTVKSTTAVASERNVPSGRSCETQSSKNHLEQEKPPFQSTVRVNTGIKQFGSSSGCLSCQKMQSSSSWSICLHRWKFRIPKCYLSDQEDFQFYRNWIATPAEAISALKLEFEDQNVVEVQLFHDKELWRYIGVRQKHAEVYHIP